MLTKQGFHFTFSSVYGTEIVITLAIGLDILSKLHHFNWAEPLPEQYNLLLLRLEIYWPLYRPVF